MMHHSDHEPADTKDQLDTSQRGFYPPYPPIYPPYYPPFYPPYPPVLFPPVPFFPIFRPPFYPHDSRRRDRRGRRY